MFKNTCKLVDILCLPFWASTLFPWFSDVDWFYLFVFNYLWINFGFFLVTDLCKAFDYIRYKMQLALSNARTILNEKKLLFLSSIKGDFPQQGLRPTCDCISGPRLIPAVYGVTRHTSCAHCRMWACPYQEDAQPHHHGPGPLSHTASHAHDAFPLDLTLRVVRFPE